MSKVTIGGKPYELNYTNQDLYDIEESFGDKSIAKILEGADELPMKKIGLIIWHGMRGGIDDFETFINTIHPGEFEKASIGAAKAINAAFTQGLKKKK